MCVLRFFSLLRHFTRAVCVVFSSLHMYIFILLLNFLLLQLYNIYTLGFVFKFHHVSVCVLFFFSVSLSLTPQSSYTHFYLALFLFFLVYTERRKIKTVFFSLVFSFGVHLHRTDQFTWCRKYFVCLLVCVAIMFVYACLCKNILLFQFDVYVEK